MADPEKLNENSNNNEKSKPRLPSHDSTRETSPRPVPAVETSPTTQKGTSVNGMSRRRGRDPRPKAQHVDSVEPGHGGGSEEGLASSKSGPEVGSSEKVGKANGSGEPLKEKGGADEGDAEGDGKKWKVPPWLQWTVDNWTWAKLKPAIRCAVVAWISALLFIIPVVQKAMGQAPFLILIAAVFAPPSLPFVAVLEAEMLILTFSATSWAWSCLGIKLANLARTNSNPNVTYAQAATGAYLEVGPTAIMLVFLGLGTAFWLYIRAVQGPGPYLFACVLAIICLDICITTAVLFPYPFYLIGKNILIPLALHSGIALLGAVLIFPSTTTSLFTTKLSCVLSPLISALNSHTLVLSTSPTSPTFSTLASLISSNIAKSEAQVLQLAVATRLLDKDLIWGRYSPGDWKVFQDMARRVTNRGNGLGLYFTLIEPTRQKFPATPAPSTPVGAAGQTPVGWGARSREQSRSRVASGAQSTSSSAEKEDGTAGTSGTPRRHHTPPIPTPHHGQHARFTDQWTDSVGSGTGRHGYGSASRREMGLHHEEHSSHYFRHHHHQLLHHGLHSLSSSRSQDQLHHGHGHHAGEKDGASGSGKFGFENVVGVFESQKYMNLETSWLHDPDADMWTERITGLLSESCTPLLKSLSESLELFQSWLEISRHGRMRYLFNPKKVKKEWEEELGKHEEMREKLGAELGEFREMRRHRVLDPWRKVFDQRTEAGDFGEKEFEGEEDVGAEGEGEGKTPAHRYLFHCYVYQYHLIQLAEIVIEMLDEMIRLEKKRQTIRLWTPIQKLIRWRHWEVSETLQHEVDEDPDAIQGLDPSIIEDLGLPMRRDPDALPPRNIFESVMSWLYHSLTGLAGGNILYAVKAAFLTVLLTLPSVIRSTAGFAQNHRFVWAIILGQVTLARFRGDTVFAFLARVLSTFLGGAVGMAMWYISCGGSPRGNPYGLAVVFAICCPFMFYTRLYYPGPPIAQIVFFVTAYLVVGYSYTDVTQTVPGSPGYGFMVWWRRCVIVSAGVFAAFIVSFLPPSTTIRRYQRAMLATTCSELGAIYCAILSYANTRAGEDVPEINASVLAVRGKLMRSIALRTNVIYEFSLRGRWPVERYNKLCDIQIQIAYSLAHFMSVVKHLEPGWARALLRRTRFMDTGFQGDILAVLTMISSALRTSRPLPQITPCPLSDRFLSQSSGLDILRKETQEDYGVPRTLTLDTLMDEQYLCFCVGVSTAFGIISRLDRLMVAAKEIVGEHYHIHGVGLTPTVTRQRTSDGSEPVEEEFRPPPAEEV